MALSKFHLYKNIDLLYDYMSLFLPMKKYSDK